MDVSNSVSTEYIEKKNKNNYLITVLMINVSINPTKKVNSPKDYRFRIYHKIHH